MNSLYFYGSFSLMERDRMSTKIPEKQNRTKKTLHKSYKQLCMSCMHVICKKLGAKVTVSELCDYTEMEKI